LQCSYYICKRDYQENKEAVDEFAKQWVGEKKPFDCYYDTQLTNRVILNKRHTKMHVINSMVWPSIIILICGIIFLHFETKRRGMPFCGENITATRIGSHHFENRNGQQKQRLEAKYSNDSTHKVKTALINDRPALSMSSIPKTVSPGPKIVIEDENSHFVRSVSADGFHDWSADDKKTKFGIRQDSTRSADGSLLTGVETPV
jgi:hypothetical protein